MGTRRGSGLLDRAAPPTAPPLQVGGPRVQDLPADAAPPPRPGGAAPVRCDEVLAADAALDDATREGEPVRVVEPARPAVAAPPPPPPAEVEDTAPSAATDETDAATPVTPVASRARRPRRLAAAAALASVLLAAGLTWAGSGADDALVDRVDRLESREVSALLRAATSQWATLAAADDANVAPDAGCWLAPEGAAPAVAGPAALCGPARFAAADAADRVWAVAPLQLVPDDGVEVVAVGPITALVAAGEVPMTRPDGTPPPRGETLPAAASPLLRTADGRRLVDAATVLEAADVELEILADREAAVLGPTAACHLAVRTSDLGPRAAQQVWCGPLRTFASDGVDRWATAAVTLVDGPDPTTAIGVIGPLELGVGAARPTDVLLWSATDVAAAAAAATDATDGGQP